MNPFADYNGDRECTGGPGPENAVFCGEATAGAGRAKGRRVRRIVETKPPDHARLPHKVRRPASERFHI